MRKLYLQIYVTILASLVIVVIAAGTLWSLFGRDHFNREVIDIAASLVQVTLPAANAPIDAQRNAVTRVGRELRIDISLFDGNRQLIGAYGDTRRPPKEAKKPGQWFRLRHGVWALNLVDGRWLVADLGRRAGRRPLVNLLLFLGSVALGVGLGAYPFVRRLTRRLERLQGGVERMGAGDLSARVDVSGKDEVARLAASFNDAAEKIEKLIGAHRMLLANASHELRTPLSRIRMGVEMLAPEDDGDKGAEAGRRSALREDIAELDTLIDEILLMSRLDSGAHTDHFVAVDLVALVAEECARFEACDFSGSAPEIKGDARLLRRLIRNLLDNAHKHGRPPVDVDLAPSGDKVTLTVRDHGFGIGEQDRERVFQPFFRGPDRQNVGGYGLGLPLVRQIARAHGGDVEIVSSDGSFSAFRVTLARGLGYR